MARRKEFLRNTKILYDLKRKDDVSAELFEERIQPRHTNTFDGVIVDFLSSDTVLRTVSQPGHYTGIQHSDHLHIFNSRKNGGIRVQWYIIINGETSNSRGMRDYEFFDQ